MSTITPHYRTVKELLQSQSFSIDEYQREYKWEEKNIVELLADLQEKFLSCYQAGDTAYPLDWNMGVMCSTAAISHCSLLMFAICFLLSELACYGSLPFS